VLLLVFVTSPQTEMSRTAAREGQRGEEEEEKGEGRAGLGSKNTQAMVCVTDTTLAACQLKYATVKLFIADGECPLGGCGWVVCVWGGRGGHI